MNQTIVLNNRPKGRPQLSDFLFIEEDMPEIRAGEILLRSCYVSVDPYLRSKMAVKI